jgi:hypothetical protein
VSNVAHVVTHTPNVVLCNARLVAG